MVIEDGDGLVVEIDPAAVLRMLESYQRFAATAAVSIQFEGIQAAMGIVSERIAEIAAPLAMAQQQLLEQQFAPLVELARQAAAIESSRVVYGTGHMDGGGVLSGRGEVVRAKDVDPNLAIDAAIAAITTWLAVTLYLLARQNHRESAQQVVIAIAMNSIIYLVSIRNHPRHD